MEEARQHSALNGLYFLSLTLFGASVFALIIAGAFHLKLAATAFTAMAFLGLLTRAAAYAGASVSLRKSNQHRATLLGVYGLIFLCFATFFFLFVVLRQFGMTV